MLFIAKRRQLREDTKIGPIRKRLTKRIVYLKKRLTSSKRWEGTSMTVERLGVTTWRWTICKTMADVQAHLPTSRLITGRGWTSRDTITIWTKVQARMTTRRRIKCRDTKTIWAEVQTRMATSILLAWVSQRARMTTSIRLARTRQEARLLGLGLADRVRRLTGRDWRQR